MKPTASPPSIRIVLADDHELVRTGIRMMVSMIAGAQVLAEARDGQELVTLTESLNPDLVLTDIAMPRMDGIAAIEHLHASRPEVRILVLTMHDNTAYIKRAIASGACGYLMKDAPPHELEQAILSVMSKGSYFSPDIASRLLLPARDTPQEQLTARQIEVLKLLAQGRSSKEIAFELSLSSKTVDVHRTRIMERLQINDLASLTRYAIRNGLIDA